MKMTTPGNKRKSDAGTAPKSNKKRKSNVNGSSDVSFNVGSTPKAAVTPSPKKKMQAFAGTTGINSANNTPKTKKSQEVNSASPGGNSVDKKNAKKLNNSSQNNDGVSPNKKQNKGQQQKGSAVQNKSEGKANKKQKKADKKHKISNEIVQKFGKRKRHSFISSLTGRLEKEPKDVIAAQIQEKIDAFEKRTDLSKSAKRKLGRLQHFLLKAKGIAPEKKTDQPQAKAKKQGKQQKANKKATPPAPKAEAVKGKKVETKPPSDDDADDDKFEESDSEEEATLPSNISWPKESDDEEEEDEANASDDEDANDSDDDENGVDNEPAAESDDDEDEEDDGEEEEGDEDESEEESDEEETPSVPAKKNKIDAQKKQPANKNNEKLNNKKPNENAANKQKQRYVLFVGNLPFDATESDVSAHFEKAGKILSVRIPKNKENNKPRGFGYVEVGDEVTYEKAFSMHQTFIKGRQIKVEYTKGGNKNSEFAKKEIKAKNAKLHALRKDGKLAGGKKESQKRSFRRKKGQQGKASN